LVALAEQRHIEKQAEIEKKKIRIIAPGGGRKPEMSAKEGIRSMSSLPETKTNF
jgi:hypothetical protein